MGRIKEVYMEIQEKFGEDVEVTEQMLEDYFKSKEENKTQTI